ncbi:signal transduction protein with HDOD/GAF domains [Thalassotalea insulae]|uniref:Signal transduction protein with HDOD/GAF domains n=1 Tax=Thalassotalea insulae TaxID=2056778 RepID=A0ABQ6GUX1_9GAMM|nr:HDOD domain-containing protein [Thalassotalea insulae]GLX79718.1 signal transduction protein with HDOD/GAF domains [Thalassotalea insulae]
MNSLNLNTKDQWIEFIAQQELPALTSIARLLEKFENDDVSSLPKLSRAILHDQALSSCVIKVANSSNRIGVSNVTTVSRATVVLGIQTVKNICLTSKIIDGLLKNEELGVPIYNRVKQLMARSFYAGQLAKMMVPEYGDDIQEELYLASMLHNVGETAFWGIGDEINGEMLNYIHLPEKDYQEKCQELLGVTFEELSVGLAKKWRLGELLVKSFDEPEVRTKEMQVIFLATKLSQFIDTPPDSAARFDRVLKEIAALMKINERKLRYQIELTRERSVKLLNSYGASVLIDYLKPIPTLGDFNAASEAALTTAKLSKEAIQLEVIQNLTQLAVTSQDINEFLQTCLIGIAQTLAFDRNCFLFLSKDKSQISCRFSYNCFASKEEYSFATNILHSNNVFRKALLDKKAVLVNSLTDAKARDLVTRDIEEMLSDNKLITAPVCIDDKTIGLICSIKNKVKGDITPQEATIFQLLIQQLNMCLSMVSRRKSG